MSTSSPARLYCTLVGAVLVIAGIIGFFYSSASIPAPPGSPRTPTRSSTSWSTAGTTSSTSCSGSWRWPSPATPPERAYCLGIGLVYVLLALWGFIDGDNVILGLIRSTTRTTSSTWSSASPVRRGRGDTEDRAPARPA